MGKDHDSFTLLDFSLVYNVLFNVFVLFLNSGKMIWLLLLLLYICHLAEGGISLIIQCCSFLVKGKPVKPYEAFSK